MMNANKQEAVTRAKNILISQQNILRSKIRQNRYDMAKLAKENAIHKRELGVLNTAIRALDDKPKKVKKAVAKDTTPHSRVCECQECRPHPTLCECFMCKPY